MNAATIALVVALAVRATPAVAEQSQPPLPGPVTPADVERVGPGVVGIDTTIPLDRPSVLTLGPLRSGSGAIVDADGYVVTVGYLLTDAERIQVRLRDGRVIPARFVGQDYESGIGVIKLEGAGPWPHVPLGDSSAVRTGDPAAIVGVTGENELSTTRGRIRDIRRFTGYWEYLLERAFIVAPPNPSFGGSPLVNARGEIIGVTSLRLGDPPNANLAIPIEYFRAVGDELFKEGRVTSRPPRPWLGLYTVETPRGLAIAGAAPAGPAVGAGFTRGDVIVRFNGEKVESQEDFYRKLWRTRTGDEVNVVVLREAGFQVISVRTMDRQSFVRPPGN
jgi:S1-C subfamily serine protease